MRDDELPHDPEIDALLASLDEEPPSISVDTVITRARAARRAGAPALRWAAAIALALVAAGVAYAAPRGAVAEWLERLGSIVGIRSDDVVVPVPGSDPAGVALDASGEVILRFDPPGLAGHARVSLTDGDEVVVRSASGSTRFISEPERLVVQHPSSDTMDIQIPRTAIRVRIDIGSATVLFKDGSQVVTAAPSDGLGGWLLALNSGSP
jgi:hypothetical protein